MKWQNCGRTIPDFVGRKVSSGVRMVALRRAAGEVKGSASMRENRADDTRNRRKAMGPHGCSDFTQIFSRKGAYARLMEWSLQDPALKTQLYRFVDVFPALRSNAEIVRHVQE